MFLELEIGTTSKDFGIYVLVLDRRELDSLENRCVTSISMDLRPLHSYKITA